jgi:hypothetical protein
VKQKVSMQERSIDTRLENWASCQRGKGGGSMSTRETRRTSPYGGGGYQCMTGVVCNLMREAAHGPKGGAASQSKLDFEDAAVINLAWVQLDVKPKLLLRDFYVLERPAHVLCRELDIRHWPASHWKRELAQAQEALQKIVDRGNCRA